MVNSVVPLSPVARPRPAPRRSSHSQHGVDASIRLLSRLQTTLEPQQLLQFYFEEMRLPLALEGLSWRCDEPGLRVRLGRQGRARCVCSLSIDGTSFGELTVSRRTPLRDDEELLLQQTLGLLIHPLRNAVLYQQALAAARRDALTGLGNRAAFDESLIRELDLARRHGDAFSLVLIDVDHFKEINDRHGHQAGDQVLRELAQILLREARHSDLLFRYAGDEFVIAMSRTGLEGALGAAERVRNAVADHRFHCDGRTIPVRISVGVATAANGEGPQDVFRRADQALFSAKRQGRDRVAAEDPAE